MDILSIGILIIIVGIAVIIACIIYVDKLAETVIYISSLLGIIGITISVIILLFDERLQDYLHLENVKKIGNSLSIIGIFVGVTCLTIFMVLQFIPSLKKRIGEIISLRAAVTILMLATAFFIIRQSDTNQRIKDALHKNETSIIQNTETLYKTQESIIQNTELIDANKSAIIQNKTKIEEILKNELVISNEKQEHPPPQPEIPKEVTLEPEPVLIENSINEPEELEPEFNALLLGAATEKYENLQVKTSTSNTSSQNAADQLFDVGISQYENSQLVKARKTFTQTSKLYYKLAKKEPDIYKRVLAMSQYNLGTVFLTLQKQEDKDTVFKPSTNKIIGYYQSALENFCNLAQDKQYIYDEYIEHILINLGSVYFEETIDTLDTAEDIILQMEAFRKTSSYMLHIESTLNKLWECVTTMEQYLLNNNIKKSQMLGRINATYVGTLLLDNI